MISVEIYLPGVNLTWFDFFTHVPYQANHPSKRATLVPSYANTEAGELPRPPVYVFARGGSIVTQKDQVKRSAILARNDTGFNLTVFLNRDGDRVAKGWVYFDDGETFNY
jgi:alpha-glucosidase (family GH31 glycosyl hydrolase)